MELNDFTLFNPLTDVKTDIPRGKGNYIVTIRDIKNLPTHRCDIVTHLFRGQKVIYTGITSKGLRHRIGNQHLGTNAGRSTLRLSIGCLLGYTLIPRDKSNPYNGMVRFNNQGEELLRQWMINNLLFYYLPNQSPHDLEIELIQSLNPPLNLQSNYNPINQDFRLLLKSLRRERPWRQ